MNCKSESILIIFILALFTGKMIMADNKTLDITTFPIEGKLDTANVSTAGRFIVLHQLVRPLTTYAKNGDLVGELLESWEILENSTKFSFKIKKSAKWSNGESISSADVIASIKRQMELDSGVHFNFSTIKEVTKLDDYRFEIKLKSRNTMFLNHISFPEFGVVKIRSNEQDLKISSGAYFLHENSPNKIVLNKNNYFPNHQNSSPSKVIFHKESAAKTIEEAKKRKRDFFIPFSMNDSEIQDFTNHTDFKVDKPHIGYTYFLSINPNSWIKSEKGLIESIQTVLYQEALEILKSKQNYKATKWAAANQLYLPDGLGRPSKEDLNFLWEDIKTKAKSYKQNKTLKTHEVKVLLDEDFPFNSQLLNALKSLGLNLIVEYGNIYKNEKPSGKKTIYDLIFFNNDYSSLELHDNLQTTFYKSRPLIQTLKDDNQYEQDLKLALQTESVKERHSIYKKIGMRVLSKGHIAPFMYEKVLFMRNNKIDTSLWSDLFPEISIWKIRDLR